MDSSPSDLTLDYTPNGGSGGTAVTGAYPMIIPKQQAAPPPPVVDDGGHHHLTSEQASTTHKVQEFLSRLEEERLKIDAFKRELPLCMQLLNQAMEAYRQQLEAYQMGSHGAGAAAAAAAAARPLVLEEFIPLKNIGMDSAEKAAGNATSEKASWMVSAQLWNGPAVDTAAAKGPQTPKERSEHPLDTSPMLGALDGGAGGGRGNGTGAFLPFTKEKAMSEGAALPELALATAEKDSIVVDAGEVDRKPLYHDASGGNNGAVGRRDYVVQNGAPPASTAPEGQTVPPPPQQTHRKARRCWSPELHRRFVNALQILGGAQVATPKQIRELMKVDGLTNDEVKSHLQKYRLHTRRPMPAPQAPTAGAPQLVVLGGIWMPPDYAAQAAGPAMYGAHPATQAHYTAAVSAQEYYQSAAVAHHLQHHPAAAMAVHRAVAPPAPSPAVYKTASSRGVSGTSQESDGRGSGGGGRERSESIDEEGEDREEDDDDDDEDEDDVNGMAAANAGAEEINATAAGAGSIKY